MTRDLRRPVRNPTLEDAWRLFATYDYNSKLTSNRFRHIRWVILALGIIATTLALIYQVYLPKGQPILFFGHPFPNSIIRFFIVLLPISVSALLTISSRFERGVSWILLRASAEAIKLEIYKFRTRTDIYSDENLEDETRDVKLARKIKSINERLMTTEVNQSGLRPYRGKLPPPIEMAAPGDDGFSFLTPPQYVECRVDNQIKWYKKRTNQLDQRIRRLHYQIIFFGALGTLLAAFEFEVWIAVTTAIVGAITSYIEYNQYEKTLTSYNIAATDLESIRIWWRALPDTEKYSPEVYEKLVGYAESVMEDESQRWIHTVQDALEKLDQETQKKFGRPYSSSLPPIPDGVGLQPVDLTPADIIAGNWLGNRLTPEDYFEEPPAETEPHDFRLASTYDKTSPLPDIENLPQADDFHLASTYDKTAPLPDIEPPLGFSPEKFDDLDNLEVTNQRKGALYPEDRVGQESSTPEDKAFQVEDKELPFGAVDLNDEDVIVDDFVPSEATKRKSADFGRNGEG
jgi:hypothetical protein